MTVLLDTGPWVPLLSRNDTHHQWAVEQIRLLQPPMLSCAAVVAETCFLLKRSGFDPSLALQLIERDVVQLSFTLQEQIASVSSLFQR
jgi:predicted nucleic acid-binding protein